MLKFPATELYITFAIAAAMLGVYVSNAGSLRVGIEGILAPLLTTFLSWLQLSWTFISINDLDSYGIFAHFFILFMFSVSILLLAVFASERDS